MFQSRQGVDGRAGFDLAASDAYDPLNRISSAATQAISGVDCWGQSFTPDALANLNSIGVTQCSAGTLSVTVDSNNHINTSTAYAYDAVGNMTKDGSGTGYPYTFDDENHLTLATGFAGRVAQTINPKMILGGSHAGFTCGALDVSSFQPLPFQHLPTAFE